jgi:hypothetical protein
VSNQNSDGYQFDAINGTNTYVIYAQTNEFSLKGNCTQPPPTQSYTTVTVYGKPTEICEPRRVTIYDITVDKIWFINEGYNVIKTCDATVTKTLVATATAVRTATIVETIVAGSGSVVYAPTETVTVTKTVTVCPTAAPPAPPTTAPAHTTTTPPYPVVTPSKNATKPTLVQFTSGAESSKVGVFAFAGIAALIAALIM